MPSFSLMAVHAHPDDECVFGGATLARSAAQGHVVVLVTCTNGEEGEIVDPELNREEVKARLGEVRLGELRAAAAILGITHLELLGYRDSGMAGTPANDDPRSFHRADPEEATGRLVALVRRYRPHVLVTYDAQGSYGHPDHIMAHTITLAAFDAAGDPTRYPAAGEPWLPLKLYYGSFIPRSQAHELWRALRARNLPVFGDPDAQEPPPEAGTPDEELTTIIDRREQLEALFAAYRAHRTQFRQDSNFFRRPLELRREYSGTEGYIRARTRVEAPAREEDLFVGIVPGDAPAPWPPSSHSATHSQHAGPMSRSPHANA